MTENPGFEAFLNRIGQNSDLILDHVRQLLDGRPLPEDQLSMGLYLQAIIKSGLHLDHQLDLNGQENPSWLIPAFQSAEDIAARWLEGHSASGSAQEVLTHSLFASPSSHMRLLHEMGGDVGDFLRLKT